MPVYLPSGLKIFDFTDVLFSNVESHADIAEKLKKRGVFVNTDAVKKYLATLRAAGFEIVYENCTYHILKSPFTFEMPKENLEGLNILFCGLDKFFFGEIPEIDRLKTKFKNIIKNFNEYKPSKDFFLNYEVNISQKDARYAVEFLRYIQKSREVKIKYLGKEKTFIPYKLKIAANGVFIMGRCGKNKKLQVIRTDLIEKVIGRNFKPKEKPEGTKFRLKGKLIKNYILRQGEIARYREGYVDVINYYEPKEMLFCRLIKYGKNCEVLEPLSDRQNFIKKLEKLLRHYKSM